MTFPPLAAMCSPMAGLIITNGDSAADLLQAAGRTETILPWRDVLHEGPIGATDLASCSAMRLPYIARRFGLPLADVAAEFAARDALIALHADFDIIELWFEHDLYDQLQLIQVLAHLAASGRREGLRLVQADDFLGAQSAATILRFAALGRPVHRADLELAVAVWAELAQPTPRAIATRVARGERMSLPFLPRALRRFLEELPSHDNGLSRTEQTILDLIADGIGQPKEMFRAALGLEEAAFMGDWSFFMLLADLAECDVPLITGLPPANEADAAGSRSFAGLDLELTMAGEDVRTGGDDHVALSGLDRWWAGTPLNGRATWRFDRTRGTLVPPAKTGA